MLSTDQKILEEGSGVRARMLEYAGIFEQLDILLIIKRGARSVELRAREVQNLRIHTVSFWRAFMWTPGVHIDVVTTQDPFEIGLIGFQIAQKLNARLQLQIHTDFLSSHFTKFSLLNKVRRVIARFLLPRADSIRVVSNRIRASLQASSFKPRAPIYVLPVFVDLEKIKNSEIITDLHKKYPQFEKIILMLSRLTKEKNVGLAIEAISEVITRNPKIGLVIVGEGPERVALEAQSLKLGVADTIIFEPWTNDVASYYKTADLFLNTSWYEGYGMVYIEAATCDLPIVSTNVGVAREVGASLVGWDRNSITEGVQTALAHPQLPKLPHLLSKSEYLTRYKQSLS